MDRLPPSVLFRDERTDRQSCPSIARAAALAPPPISSQILRLGKLRVRSGRGCHLGSGTPEDLQLSAELPLLATAPGGISPEGVEGVPGWLFLEEVLKSRPRIERPRGRSLPFAGGSRGKEGALVPCVLFGDPRGDGLGAFESACRVEERALLAAMKFGPAPRAFALLIQFSRQDCRAGRAAPHGTPPRHRRRPRPERFRLLLRAPLAFLATGVHVTFLLILPVHNKTSLFHLWLFCGDFAIALIIRRQTICRPQRYDREADPPEIFGLFPSSANPRTGVKNLKKFCQEETPIFHDAYRLTGVSCWLRSGLIRQDVSACCLHLCVESQLHNRWGLFRAIHSARRFSSWRMSARTASCSAGICLLLSQAIPALEFHKPFDKATYFSRCPGNGCI